MQIIAGVFIALFLWCYLSFKLYCLWHIPLLQLLFFEHISDMYYVHIGRAHVCTYVSALRMYVHMDQPYVCTIYIHTMYYVHTYYVLCTYILCTYILCTIVYV